MKKFNLLTIIMYMFIISYGFAQGQQSAYYQKAAKLYREAAVKTNCPSTRGKVLKEYAEWNESMVKVLAGTLSSAGAQPTTSIPPCDGDMIGSVSNSSNLNSRSGSLKNNNFSSTSAGTYSEQTAVTDAMNTAYQDALNSGKKDSGAILQSFLSAAEITNDIGTSSALVGTGLVLSGIIALAEKKGERFAANAEKEKLDELERQKQQAKLKIISEKNEAIINFEKKFFKYDFSNLARKAILLVYPVKMTDQSQNIYISNPIIINAYSDGSFPLKENVKKNIANTIPDALKNNLSFAYLIAYPILEQNDFSQILTQIGSVFGLINLNPQIITANYTNTSSGTQSSTSISNTDFWGKPIKENKIETNKTTNDFWNN